VGDALARRSRLLFLDARGAAAAAPRVAELLSEELGSGFDAGASLRSFEALAARYASHERRDAPAYPCVRSRRWPRATLRSPPKMRA